MTLLSAFVSFIFSCDSSQMLSLTPNGGVLDIGSFDDTKFGNNPFFWLTLLDDTYYSVPLVAGQVVGLGGAPSEPMFIPPYPGAATPAYPQASRAIWSSGSSLVLGPPEWLAQLLNTLNTTFQNLPKLINLLQPEVSECCQPSFFTFCFHIFMVHAHQYCLLLFHFNFVFMTLKSCLIIVLVCQTNCAVLSGSEVAQYPSLQFSFDSQLAGQPPVVVPLAPQDYIIFANDSTANPPRTCALLGFGQTDIGGFVFGNVFLQVLADSI
jgi:hypothetical protein